MKNNYEKYRENHIYCPKCGGENHEETTIGYIVIGENFKDRNKVKCPCGFYGIVHDLVKNKCDI